MTQHQKYIVCLFAIAAVVIICCGCWGSTVLTTPR